MMSGPPERGFTLVEMMVALSLFAGIATMGVALLRSSVDTQAAVQNHLADMGGFNRLRAVMAHDLGQALPRSTRDEAGAEVPAFIGGDTDFWLVHGGANGLGGQHRPDAQRVRYAFEDAVWSRASQPMLDGAAMGPGDALARKVTGVALRYRDAAGLWHRSWPTQDGVDLPSAVEVVITRQHSAPLKMLFRLAPMPIPERRRMEDSVP